MKKYKLKKCYPGSPELDTEIFKWDYLKPKDERYNYNGNLGNLLLIKPEDYPEFWEPVTEKEFEILEVSYKDKIYNRFDGCFWYDKSYRITSDITGRIHTTSLHMVIIIKIKRLSDNVEFSIGDLCYPKSKPLNCGKITSFEFCKASYFRISSKSKYYIGINDIVKTKEPLFTTEDNFEVFDGDHGLWVNDNFESYHLIFSDKSKIYYPGDKYKWFLKDENAQEYIGNNKPIYSKNQIDSTISKCYISTSMGNFIKEYNFKQHLNLKL